MSELGGEARLPIRILAVGNMYPPHHAGGYEVMWQAAVQRARDLGHRVRVLTSDYHAGEDLPEAHEDVHRSLRWYWDLDRYQFPALGPLDRLRIELNNGRELRRHLDEFQPELVTWWSMGCMSLSLIERVRRVGLPAVFVVHDDWLVYGRQFDQWIRMWRGNRALLAPAADRLLGIPTRVNLADAGRFVFNSHYTRDAARRAGLDPTEATVIHPGIELALQHRLPSRPWRWQLLYIGRIDRQKGIDAAVRALAHLPPEATLDVWGTGSDSYVEEMRRLARELGVEGRVNFRGWAGASERISAYDRADVVVFPARWEEPFGLVPLEAMGVGRPVASTARGGTSEFLRDGENALVVNPDDPAGLADAVERLAADRALRDRLLEGGRKTAERHTVDRFADDTVQALVDAASAGQERRRQKLGR